MIGVGCTRLCDFKRGCDGEVPDSVAVVVPVDEVIADRRKKFERSGDSKHLEYEKAFQRELRKKGKNNPELRYKEPLVSQFCQRSEVICLPSSPRRAGSPARATALSDWMICLGLPRACEGEPAVTNHKSVLQTGTSRSREVTARIGVTSDEAETLPGSELQTGRTRRSPSHQ